MAMAPIRILHSVSNMDRAGLETMLMSYYRHMDRDLVQFDFLCNKKKPGAYDEEIKSMGGRVYRTPGLNPLKYPRYLQYMKRLFQKYPYRILEGHNETMAVYALHAAKVNHVPVRICHAHNTSIGTGWKVPIRLVCKVLLPYNLNYRFSCGRAAAGYYFGKKTAAEGNYVWIPNALEADRFVFRKECREKIRRQYGLEGRHVIGHVGRFMAQKNHAFLLDIFEEAAKRDPKAYLVFLGDGELLETMKQTAAQKGLADKVLFAGNVGNANEWYNAFDAFVLPSHFEGLPVVGVEAQANDLPCFFSENITREIALSDKARFLSLKAPASEWAESILKACGEEKRRDNMELITKCHYNVAVEAKKLQKRYLDLYEQSIQNRR